MEYFEELLNAEEEQDNIRTQGEEMYTEEHEIEEPTDQEIEEICKKMNNNKSTGENGIPAEIIKYGGNRLQQKINVLIKKVWRKKIMPEQWNKAIIYSIHKKGDKSECQNYRGISVLDVTYKILAKLVSKRLQVY